MPLLSPLLLLVPALAAPPPALVRCEVTVLRDDLAPLVIAGHGRTEVDAGQAAEHAARFVSDQRVALDLALGTLLELPDVRQRGIDALHGTDVADPLRVLGATLQTGGCSTLSLPKSKRGWSATWQASAPLTRSEPALAVEAARRRSCVLPYQERLVTTLDALSAAPAAERAAIATAGWGEAVDGLEQCYRQPSPAPAPTRDGFGAARLAPTTCSVLELGSTGPALTATGWGSTPDAAAEEALAVVLTTRSRTVLGRALHAGALASPATRSSLITTSLSDLGDLVAPSDLLDLASLVCTSIAEPDLIRWQPNDDIDADRCALPDREWPIVGPLAASPAETTRAAQDLCGAWYRDLVRVQVAVEAAAPQSQVAVVAEGYGRCTRCESLCLGGAAAGEAGEPVPLRGLPDRSTEAAARALLDEAITTRNIELLAVGLPGILTPDFGRRMANDPDQVWGTIQRGWQTGELAGAFEWTSRGGVWFAVKTR